jgi:EipB-like
MIWQGENRLSAHQMPAPCSLVVAVCLLAALQPATAQGVGEAPVRLAPHRAVYDISLDPKRSARAIDAASGRLAFDMTGDACTGYAMSFRQVTVLESSETGRRTIDTRMTTLEEADAAGFRFKIDSSANGAVSESSDGRVQRRDGQFVVRMTKPKAEERKLEGAFVFPSAQLKTIIQAARRGETTLDLKVFDGSEEGKLVYDTLTVIGSKLVGGPQMEDQLKAAPELTTMPRWPVKISYFKPGEGDRTPSYSVSFELFENGVSRAVKMDYNDFVLDGKLSRFEAYPAPACVK